MAHGVFDSSRKGMTALLGGHVDLYASSVDAPVPHICVFSGAGFP